MSATSDHPEPTAMAAGRHARTRPRRRRRAGVITGVLLGAAGSTLVTAATAAIAGYQADRVLQPIEFTLRVVLILLAPCVGAAAAHWLLTLLAGRHVEPPPTWAVGTGAVAGPVGALRLDRVLDYGTGPILATAAVIVAWAVVATALTNAVARRAAHTDRTELPPGPLPPGPATPHDRPPTTPGDDAPTSH